MRKAAVLLLIVLMLLTGCQKQEPIDDLTERIIRKTVSSMDNYGGYTKNNKYVLEGPYQEENSEFPLIYEVKVNGEVKFYSICSYAEQIPIGGIWESYENGYISVFLMPCDDAAASGIDVSKMKKGNRKISFNDYLMYPKQVIIEEGDVTLLGNDELDKLINDTAVILTLQEELKPGDRIAVTGPLTAFYTEFDKDKVLHLNPIPSPQYLVCLNGVPIYRIYVNGPDNWITLPLDENSEFVKLITANEKFALVRESIITEKAEYREDMVPAEVRESLKKVQEYLRDMEQYKNVRETTITELPDTESSMEEMG